MLYALNVKNIFLGVPYVKIIFFNKLAINFLLDVGFACLSFSHQNWGVTYATDHWLTDLQVSF